MTGKTPDEFRAGVLSHLEEQPLSFAPARVGPSSTNTDSLFSPVAASAARAHREGPSSEDHVSDAERAAIVAIADALGTTSGASA